MKEVLLRQTYSKRFNEAHGSPARAGNALISKPATKAIKHRSSAKPFDSEPALTAYGSPARQAYSKGLMRHKSPVRQATRQLVSLLQWHTQSAHRVQIQFF